VLWGTSFWLSIFPSRACVLMNNKNSKFSCFPSIFFEDYHCQVISRSKSTALSAFAAALMNEVQLLNYALTNEVQLLENSSSDRNYLLPWNTQSLWSSVFPVHEEILSFDFLLKSDWCAPFRFLDETRAYWLQSLSLKFFRRECDKLYVWILKCELCIWSSHLGFLT